jgi:hypothetical protein
MHYWINEIYVKYFAKSTLQNLCTSLNTRLLILRHSLNINLEPNDVVYIHYFIHSFVLHKQRHTSPFKIKLFDADHYVCAK